MDKWITTDGPAERYEHHGYTILVDATEDGPEQWMPRIEVSRDGQPVPLVAPESIDPFWATREEAIREGLERARFLLDRRDEALLELRNPAR